MRRGTEQSEPGLERLEIPGVFYSEDSEKPEEDIKLGASFSFYGIQESGEKETELCHENQAPAFEWWDSHFLARKAHFHRFSPRCKQPCGHLSCSQTFGRRNPNLRFYWDLTDAGIQLGWRAPEPGDTVPSRCYHLKTSHSKKQSRPTDRQGSSGNRHTEKMKERKAGIHGRGHGVCSMWGVPGSSSDHLLRNFQHL